MCHFVLVSGMRTSWSSKKKKTQENNVEWGERMSFTFVPGLKLNYREATVQSI